MAHKSGYKIDCSFTQGKHTISHILYIKVMREREEERKKQQCEFIVLYNINKLYLIVNIKIY